MNRQIKKPSAKALRTDVYDPTRFTKRETKQTDTSACRTCSRPILRQKDGLKAHLNPNGTALCAGSVRLSPEDELIRVSAENRVRRKYRLVVCSSCGQLVNRTPGGSIQRHESTISKRCENTRQSRRQPPGAITRPAPTEAHQFRHTQKSALLEYERLVRREILQIMTPIKKQSQRENSGFRGLTTEELLGRTPESKHRNDPDRPDGSFRPYFDRTSVSLKAVNGGSPGSSRRKF